MDKTAATEYDYVIVGAGSAGCVLTNRLSEVADTSICVLEAGPSDWHPYIHLPAGFIKTFHMKSINWAYQQEPGPWTGGRSIYAPRGKTLGGSSSINGMLYVRGQPQDFDDWAAQGLAGWGWRDVLPWFRKIEDDQDEVGPLHGRGGPIPVRRWLPQLLWKWRGHSRTCADPGKRWKKLLRYKTKHSLPSGRLSMIQSSPTTALISLGPEERASMYLASQHTVPTALTRGGASEMEVR